MAQGLGRLSEKLTDSPRLCGDAVCAPVNGDELFLDPVDSLAEVLGQALVHVAQGLIDIVGENADIAQTDLVIKGHEVLSMLSKALRIEPENVTARQLLSDYYWNCFQDVANRGNHFKRDIYQQMIARFHATTSDMDRYTEG